MLCCSLFPKQSITFRRKMERTIKEKGGRSSGKRGEGGELRKLQRSYRGGVAEVCALHVLRLLLSCKEGAARLLMGIFEGGRGT